MTPEDFKSLHNIKHAKNPAYQIKLEAELRCTYPIDTYYWRKQKDKHIRHLKQLAKNNGIVIKERKRIYANRTKS